MMFRRIVYFALTLFSVVYGKAQEIVSGKEAEGYFEGASEVYYNNPYGLPSYVRIASPFEADPNAYAQTLTGIFKLPEGTDWKIIRTDDDGEGWLHYRYQAYLHSIPVEGSTLIVHTRNGKIHAFNAEWFPRHYTFPEVQMKDWQALERLLEPGTRYAWQDEREQELLREITQDPRTTWYPKGNLVWYSAQESGAASGLKLCWKFDVYALEPHNRSVIYINAGNGLREGMEPVLCHVEVNGTARTKYAGTQAIRVDSVAPGNFRLRETARGGGIDTYDNSNGTDFTDNNKIWDSTVSVRQQVAGDLHFASEKTYDYFKTVHNRNSYNNANGKLIAILQGNFVNAFWNGTYSAYGMGSGSWGPVAGIDVVGHEFTHGLTQSSSNLVYSGESGALNESFSDIFGKLIEYYGLKQKFSWYLGGFGAGSNKGFRNMKNPNEKGCPDTYGGKYWNAGDIVHYNSSVQNFWFYLLSTGGSGTNDSGHVYYVDSIGMEKAGKVAYRNNTVYLTKNSNFKDARFYGIKSAQDLYGDCSRETEAVTNAWYAVGVGKGYLTPAGKPKGTGIEPYNPRYCSSDSVYDLSFKNPYSYSGINYLWNFGDGTTSNLSAPSHVFKGYGLYRVVLRTEYCFKYYYDTTLVRISQKPTADFSINDFRQCLNKNRFRFTAAAASKAKRKLHYQWSSKPALFSGSDTVLEHIFDATGNYEVKLVVTDDLGCMNEITKPIEILESPAFDFTFKNSCPGAQVVFKPSNLPDTALFSYTLKWDLAEGISSTAREPVRVFDSPGVYPISLTNLTGHASCADTVTRPITIYKGPDAAFSWDSLCPGVNGMFRRLPGSDTIHYLEWNFGIYKPSDLDSVAFAFTKPGVYPVSLRTVSKKCVGVSTRMVHVGTNPVAQFTASDVCAKSEQTILNGSKGVNAGIVSGYWDFGDGTVSGDYHPVKGFENDGHYTVKLTVTDSRGCKGSVNQSVRIFPLPVAGFEVQDICEGETAGAVNRSISPDNGPLTYQWYRNNTPNGNTEHLSLVKLSAGTHALRLEAITEHGCKSEATATFRVKTLPNASFTGLNTTYCAGDKPVLQPFVSGGSWFLNQNSMQTGQALPVPGVYQVMYKLVKDGCRDSSVQQTRVVGYPAPELGNDIRLCEALELNVNAETADATRYRWNTGSTDPQIRVHQSGVYRVSIEHPCGVFSDSITLTYFGSECPWFVPDAISPNGDGINDVFEVKGRQFDLMELTVYNRLLQIVYTYKGPYRAWDGSTSFNEPLGLGVYPIKLVLTAYDGEVISHTGSITLVK